MALCGRNISAAVAGKDVFKKLILIPVKYGLWIKVVYRDQPFHTPHPTDASMAGKLRIQVLAAS